MPSIVPWLHRGLRILITLLCLAIAWHAFAYLYQAFNPRNPFHVSFAASGWAVPGHFFAAGLALALAPMQLAAWIRQRAPRLHRISGWLYVHAVLIGGICGLLLAPSAQGGMANTINFSLLSVLWIAFTARALQCVLVGDIDGHRRWMLRSIALTFAAVTLRLYLGAGIFLGLSFNTAYIAAAWLCWTINLAVCELLLRRPLRSHAGIGSESGRASA